MIQEITKKDFRNIDALWKWIKRECERDNVESLKLETLIDDIPIDNSPIVLKHISGRILTIELGDKIDGGY